MPIICGGTNYYIESLIWKILIEDESKSTENEIPSKKTKISVIEDYASNNISDCECKDGTFDTKNEGNLNQDITELKSAEYIDQISNMDLYSRLQAVDPQRANDLHFNERRKIIRSLEVYDKLKRPHSDILKDQKSEVGGGLLGGPLRFHKNSLVVLWVQCDQTVLDKRCDMRVNKMIEQGMLDELEEFHNKYNKNRTQFSGKEDKLYNKDYIDGIFQSIGFKEFHDYLTSDDSDEVKKKLYTKGGGFTLCN